MRTIYKADRKYVIRIQRKNRRHNIGHRVNCLRAKIKFGISNIPKLLIEYWKSDYYNGVNNGK